MKEQNDKDYIFGIHNIEEALVAGRPVDKLLVRKGAQGGQYNKALTMARNQGVVVQAVPVEKINRVTRKNHQGILAFISPVPFQKLDEIVARAYEAGRDPFIMLLDGVTDVRNFGAIARTAECAGMDAIVLPYRNSAAVNAAAMKTSAGALNHLPVCKVPNMKSAISQLKKSGLSVAAASERGDTPLHKAKLDGPLALVMGAEDTGLSPEVLKGAGQLISIPIAGRVSSLNVSVSAGVLIYEALRQRGI